jgi:Tfp pilus assembly protein PilO
MSTQDRTLIMVVVAVVVAAGSWFLLIKPKRNEAATLQTKVEQAQMQMDSATASAAAATAARAQYGRDYATVVRLGKAVPTDDDIASLMYQLDTSAEKTGVDFRTVAVTDSSNSAPTTPGQSKSGEAETLPGNVTQIPITMTFTGGYFQMTRFLREVERYTVTGRGTIDVRGRLVSIDGVTLKPGAGGFARVQAEVTATAYRAPVEQVGAAPAAGGAATPASTGSAGSSTPTTESTTASSKTPPTAAARVGK